MPGLVPERLAEPAPFRVRGEFELRNHFVCRQSQRRIPKVLERSRPTMRNAARFVQPMFESLAPVSGASRRAEVRRGVQGLAHRLVALLGSDLDALGDNDLRHDTDKAEHGAQIAFDVLRVRGRHVRPIETAA